MQRKIAKVLPCRVAPLHDAPMETLQADIVVSDVAMDSPVAIEMLRVTLERYRKEQVPLLFILRDVNQQSIRRAIDLGASKILDAACPQHMLIATLSRLLSAESVSPSTAAEVTARSSLPSYAADARAVVGNMMDAARRNEIIAPDSIAAGADLVLDAIQSNSVRSWLEVVWTYDDVTYKHCLLVAGFAASFGLELGFSRNDSRRLTGAALLHDIGKAWIPKDILNKPGRLTEEEMQVMRTHSATGAELLVRQRRFGDDMISVVRHHHEYLDGTGYPGGLKANEIDDLVRMTTICDIYAALIERRPYKEPMSINEAFGILAGMTGKLDPASVRAFEAVIRHS